MIKRFSFNFIKVLPTLFGICLLAFLLVRLVPGDPVMVLLGERGNNPEVYALMKKNLGLDLPLYQQFFVYLKRRGAGALDSGSAQNVLERFAACTRGEEPP